MLKVFYRNFLIFTAILFVCASSLGYLMLAGEDDINQSDDWVIHTHETIIQAEQLNSLIEGMLASQRGYLMTKNESFSEKYKNKKLAVTKHLTSLKEQTKGNASQQSRLEELQKYFIVFSTKLEERAMVTTPEQIRKTLADVVEIDTLRNNITRLNNDFLYEEYQMLNERLKTVELQKNQYFSTLLIGGLVAVTLLLLLNGYLLQVQSKRSAAEIALGEREEIFRLAIEGTQDGIFDWNLKTNDVFYSDQFVKMLGYDPEEFMPTLASFADLLHPEDKDQVWEHLDLYIDGQLSEYSSTFRMRHESGRWVWVNSRATLVRDKKNNPARLVGAYTDVSAAKEYELKLQEAKNHAESANKAKSDFLAHMSHEIRTPLTTINGAAEILSKESEDLAPKKQKLLNVLSSSAETLKDLITDILDFSKIENGQMELDESLFDLEQAFQSIVSVMSVRTTEKNLDFKFDYSDVKNMEFYGDPVRLRQILVNLIGNAIKFTEKGHVNVKASTGIKNKTPILKIEVSDSGVGIKEEHQSVIFQRFKQGDASVSRKFGGTGLGLPISRNLASLMGGTIEFESTTGIGSKFTLILPIIAINTLQAEQTVKASSESETKIKKIKVHDMLKAAITDQHKILMVEDYEGNIVVLSYILESLECSFDVATTGLEALNLWKENHYDLILMDIQMPEMDGFTATEQIRTIEAQQNLKSTPIIGMTAHALVGDKDKCIEAGMDAYLPKPIVDVDLKRTILKYLNKKAA